MRMTVRRLFPLWVLTAASLGCPAVRADIFTVGADPACTHTSVIAAVFAAVGNGPGMDEIRIATNMTQANVVAPIVDQSVHFGGGYSDCSDTMPVGRTVLHGATSGPSGTFATSGIAADYRLILENIEIRDAGNSTRRGGALRIEGRFDVDLRNVAIVNNRAGRGGGVYLDGLAGGSLSLSDGTTIESNTATISGGGLYCVNGGVVHSTTAILFANVAEDGGSDAVESGNGGGAALYGCRMTQVGTSGFNGVLANRAARHGGGFYLRAGAELVLDGNGEGPALVVANTAADTGGGLAINDPLPVLEGAISTATIRNSRIDANSAPSGAGLGLIAGGDVTMQRTLAGSLCHDATRCSSLSSNDKPASAESCIGAAVFASDSAVVTLQNTYVEQNCPSDHGWAFRQRLDSRVRIDSSVVAHSGGSQPFFIDGRGIAASGVWGFTGLLEIAWSTVTGNSAGTRFSFISLPSSSPESTGTFRVYGSLLGEPFLAMTGVGGLGDPPPMTLEFDCLLLDSVFPNGTSSMRAVKADAPYGMVDPANGDYRLTSVSVGPLDYCDQSRAPRANGDISGSTGVFDASRTNIFGPYDLGANEYTVNVVDGLFASGFE
jgi:hypothetical protein